jgi:hypothetical protein
MPDVIVLQDMSNPGTRRVPRIQELNRRMAELAHLRGIVVHKYSRARMLDHFMERGGTTKQKMAETIAKQVPAFSLYVPPERKPWMSEDRRMGIFDAAALAWMYFHDRDGDRRAAIDRAVERCASSEERPGLACRNQRSCRSRRSKDRRRSPTAQRPNSPAGRTPAHQSRPRHPAGHRDGNAG